MVINDDILKWCAEYKGEKFHAILCDPPYELNFMGKGWDNTGIAFRKETWLALSEHLYDGAFIMAFASSRGFHRMAVAMEDAGLIAHPFIGWVYGSGFPKATRIDTQIDKQAGVESRTIPNPLAKKQTGQKNTTALSGDRDDNDLLKMPSTPLAKAFIGHRYGLQALKPSLEPILVFQKPYKGKPLDCITKSGTGCLNIDGGRIAGEPWKWGTQTDIKGGGYGNKRPSDGDVFAKNVESNPQGRWPANVVLGHTPECRQIGDKWECPDYCPIRRLGEQSGEGKSNIRPPTGKPLFDTTGKRSVVWNENNVIDSTQRGHIDEGTASRYFFNTDWVLEQTDPFFYCAKASRSERDLGLDGQEPTDIPYAGYRENYADTDSYVTKYPDGRDRPMNKPLNGHPTIKPIKLTQHLATLLLPPKEYAPRRLLVPFAGVGSEMIGAILSGWEEVVGIEMDAEYCKIAEQRIKYWSTKSVSKPVDNQGVLELGI